MRLYAIGLGIGLVAVGATVGQTGGEAALAAVATDFGPFGVLALWFHERLKTVEEELTRLTTELLANE